MSKSVEDVRRAAFRKIFANPPYEFSMARYTEDSTSWPGNYLSYHVECAWEGFNAALDSICIELPDERSGDDDISFGYGLALADCRAAIEQTGLGIKCK